MRIRQVRQTFNGSRFVFYWNRRIVTFSPGGPKASPWLNEQKKAAFIVVNNIPNEKYEGTMTVDINALPAGITLQAHDAMLDHDLGAVDQPIPLSILPMRYRMVTVGLRTPPAGEGESRERRRGMTRQGQ